MARGHICVLRRRSHDALDFVLVVQKIINKLDDPNSQTNLNQSAIGSYIAA